MAKDTASKIAALKSKKQQLAKRLSALEQKEKTDARKRETRQKIIVGGLVLAHMQKDEGFARVVRGLLVEHVTRPHDREAVAELLNAAPGASGAKPAASQAPMPANQSSPALDFGRLGTAATAKTP